MSIVDKHLLKREENRKIRPPNMYYVTDGTKECIRDAYYGVFLDLPSEAEKLRIFNAGNVLEPWWIHVLNASPRYRVIETQVRAYHFTSVNSDDVEIHGRLDALVQHNDQALVGHEVKSQKNLYYVRSRGARKAHIHQCGFYCTKLGLVYGQIDYLDKAAFLQGANPIDYQYPINQDAMEEGYNNIIQTIRILHGYCRGSVLPPKNKCWKCDGYCDHRVLCDVDYNPAEDSDGEQLKKILYESEKK